MLDIKFIRENTKAVKKAIKDKNISLDLDSLLSLDEKRLVSLKKVEGLNAEKNKLNLEMKDAKNDEDRKLIIEKGKANKEQYTTANQELNKIEKEYHVLMVKVPTVPSEDTPIGKGEDDNVAVSSWGEKKEFDFEPKDHVDIAENLDIIDFKTGSKVSGYRGYYLKNESVCCERFSS